MTSNTEQRNTMVNFGRLSLHYVTFRELWTIGKLKKINTFLINHKKEKDMQNQLNAKNLKAVLWESINKVKAGKMTHADADSIATSAREILRTTHTQLRIAAAANRNVSDDVIEFSESTILLKGKKTTKQLSNAK